MLIEGAFVFNVFRRIFERKTVLVRDGIFIDVAEQIKTGPGEERVSAEGLWMIPGLVDIHLHIESSMTFPGEFSRAVLPFGTCTAVADPHEIANVFGAEGVRQFMNAPARMDIFYALPSSVPSTNARLETTGGSIGPEEIAELATDSRVICLGEVMNARELCADGDNRTKQILRSFARSRSRFPVPLPMPTPIIEGHCPRISGSALSAFIAAGVWADHTQQTPELMLEKIDKGMFIELQRKSLGAENIKTIVEHNLFEHVALVTDDVMPDELAQGHLNLLVREAVARGMRPEDAVYCATYTPSRHMGLRDRGAIAPGRIADCVLLRDMNTFEIDSVYKRGNLVGGQDTARESAPAFPPHFYTSVKRKVTKPSDFQPPLPPGFSGETADCVTLRIEASSTFTRRGRALCPVKDGKLQWQQPRLSLIAVAERYGHEAPLSFVLGEGMITGNGAIAASWAHDHHNILALGSNGEDMALAVNTVIKQQGGFVVVNRGRITGNIKLDIGGIISSAPMEQLAESVRRTRRAMRELGYKNRNELMSFSTLSLLVSPDIKISDKGLVDVRAQEPIPLFHHLPWRRNGRGIQ
ncbi:MAG: amidohydrolase family protein [Spirochaetaceae bacterium]|jgi:adenine deaminase|nr:amidohydrolase family protein [Spirochaetaceae bacterium]